MKRKQILRYSVTTLILIVIGWIVITLYVEQTGPSKQWSFGTGQGKSALVVYDPDPFYNLDEQVCRAFGETMAKDSMIVTVATVAAAESLEPKTYDVLVYCANTYSWRPDWAITNYIEEH